MHESLTDFGLQHLHRLLRLRVWTAAGALFFAFLVQLAFRDLQLAPVLALLVIQVVYNQTLVFVRPRLPDRALVQLSLWVDTAIVTAAVYFTGGIEGGLASLYVWIVFIAGLLLGIRSVPFYTLVSLLGFSFNVYMDLSGLDAPLRLPHRAVLEVAIQLTLLTVLSIFAYSVSRYRSMSAQQMEQEKRDLDRDRLSAERARSRWELVNRLTHDLLETLEPQAIVERACANAVQILEADAGLVLLPDDSRGLIVRAQTGLDESWLGTQQPELVDSPIGRVMRTRQPEIWGTPERGAIQQVPPAAWERWLPYGLAAPMLAGGRAFGVIALVSRQARAWPDQAQMLSLLSDQAAIALERAHYFEQVQSSARELNLLFEAQRATSLTLEADEIFQRLLEQLLRAFDVTSAHFMDLDEAGGTCATRCSAYSPAATSRERESRRTALVLADLPGIQKVLLGTAAVFQHSDPDLAATERSLFEESGVQTIALFPLRVAGKPVGFLALWESRAPRSWTDRELRLVETIAAQTSGTMANARSYAEARNRSHELEALERASQRLNSALSVQQICQVAVAALRELFSYEHVAVYFITNGALALQTQQGFGDPPSLFPLTRGIMVRSVVSRKPVYVPDVDEDADFIPSVPGVQSEVALPLLHGDQVIGVLNIETLKPRRLDADDVRVLSTFANEMMIAIENGRLFDETRQRLNETQVLYEFASSLDTTTNIETLSRRALDSIARLIRFDIGGVSLVDEPGGLIVPVAYHGLAGDSELMAGRALDLLHTRASDPEQGIGSWVVRHGEPVRLGDAPRDPRYREWFPQILSELCVPMKVGDQVMGVIDVESRWPNAFDERAEQLLVTFANQLAIAITNVRLYEQTRIDAEIKAALLRELSHRVKNNLAAITSLLQLALAEPPEDRDPILAETLGRAQSMVIAHTLLASSDLARVSLAGLADQVLTDAVRHLAPPDSDLQVRVSGADVEIGPRQLTTVALVLNELATNAIRHGLEDSSDRARGCLELAIERTFDGARMTLADNGLGLPDGFDLDSGTGIGLELIRTLVSKDLHGKFSLTRRGGWTCAVVEFALDD